MDIAEKEGRLMEDIPIEPGVPVDTWWDLGVSDSSSIIFTQTCGAEFHVVDYLEDQGKGLASYIERVRAKGYPAGSFNAPHDIKVREFALGKSRLEHARSLGVHFRIVPKLLHQDDVDCVRRLLPKCWFARKKCERLIECLRQYHREYDEKSQEYSERPVHDWSSHGSSAMRYFAVGVRDSVPKSRLQLTANENWGIFDDDNANVLGSEVAIENDPAGW